MRAPLSLLDAERPPPPGPDHVARGDVAALLLTDLARDGVAVLQGPAGSGTTSIAGVVATRWEGPVVWKRPGLFVHLADLARPLWDAPPAALQQAPVEAAVQAVLDRVRETGALWVLDDFDDALEPPPGPAVAKDPDLAVLIAALEARELAQSAGAVLLVSRRTPRGLTSPSRPIPPLTVEEASTVAGRDCSSLDSAWRRRPAALALLAGLPTEAEAPHAAAFDDLLEAFADGLDDSTATVLLAAAMAVHPVGATALFSATGLPREEIAPAIAGLTRRRLLRPRGAGWVCLRHVAEAALTVLPDRLPGVLQDPLLGRLAGFYLRQGDGTGRGWENVDPAITSRFALRLAARAGYPQMAVNTALYAGHAAVLERFGALRHLRDDLGVGLARRTDELGALDEARARLARATAAARLGDHEVVDFELTRALRPAEAAGDADLLRSVHTRLAGRLLVAGDPGKAVPHLQHALVLARRAGLRAAESDLLNGLAGVALSQGDHATAERHFQQARAAADEADDPRRAARADAGLGGVAMAQGRLREAETVLTAAADAAAALEDGPGEIGRRANIAAVRAARGDLRGALKAVRHALGVDAAEPRSRARLLCLRAELLRLAGDPERAARTLDEAEALIQQAGDRALAADLASGRAALAALAGEWDDAVMARIEAVRALGKAVPVAAKAAAEVARWNAEAWRGAADLLAGDRSAVSAVLDAARRATEQLQEALESPSALQRRAAELIALEAGLLAATVAGTAPMGALRRSTALHAEAAADPERHDPSEPALRAVQAWAMRLCGSSEAEATAKRAALDAGLASMATVRGEALVFAGRAAEVDPWNGRARLLAEYFAPTPPA